MSINDLVIEGTASSTVKFISLEPSDLGLNLLKCLHEKGLPIASSCRGRGACQRCLINDDVLACSMLVSEFLIKYGNRIKVSYL